MDKKKEIDCPLFCNLKKAELTKEIRRLQERAKKHLKNMLKNMEDSRVCKNEENARI